MPNSKGSYSIEEIKNGLEKFFLENGHYPSALEIDKCPYLPSSRQIQRNLGGLVKFREQISLSGPSDYTKGEVRSEIAVEADIRAKKYETEFYNYLISKVDEVRVHEHKIIRPGGVASDFFVYASNKKEGIFIDLFYAKDMHSLAGIVTIKAKKPIPQNIPVYFVMVGNSDIDQDGINKLISNRKNPLSPNIKVITESYFKTHFENILSVRQIEYLCSELVEL